MPPQLFHRGREDDAGYERALKERLPAVLAASRRLQARIGIETGSRMIGRHPVFLWEMPAPPKLTTTQIVENWKRTFIKKPVSNATDTAEQAVSESIEDDDEETVSEESQSPSELLWNPPVKGDENYGKLVNTASFDRAEDTYRSDSQNGKAATQTVISKLLARAGPQKRPRHNTLLPTTQPGFPLTKKPKIGGDLTARPGGDTNSEKYDHQIQAVESRRPEPRLDVADAHIAASPPPDWMANPSFTKPSRMPVYWMPNLSEDIAVWLQQAETRSSQTLLSYLELRRGHPAGPEAILHRCDAKDYAKLKLSRLAIPPAAQSAMAPPQLLDWLILEVDYQDFLPDVNEDSSDGEDKVRSFRGMPRMAGRAPPKSMRVNMLPYWILAFPIQAVTSSHVSYRSAPASPLASHVSRKKAGKRMPKSRSPVQVTTITLGKIGRVPLVHGRGVGERILDDFAQACAQGTAVIEVRGLDKLSFP